jgi:hypothetical protein
MNGKSDLQLDAKKTETVRMKLTSRQLIDKWTKLNLH